MTERFDAGYYYYHKFDKALTARYGTTFREGFERIQTLYRPIRQGSKGHKHGRDITVRDVLQIFEADLPYVQDWTKPNEDDLAERMEKHKAGALIRQVLSAGGFDRSCLRQLRHCFRELGLLALVLQHVDPARFAMCSHHLASILLVEGETVQDYYIDYCKELKLWSERSRHELTVAQTEFGLWAWYYLAHYPVPEEKSRYHRRVFDHDQWVQQRKADKIASMLAGRRALDLARAFLESAPTVAAVLCWREFETALRSILKVDGKPRLPELFTEVVTRQVWVMPEGWNQQVMEALWYGHPDVSNRHYGELVGRDAVMHGGKSVEREQAAKLIQRVGEFLEHNECRTRNRGRFDG